VIYGGILLTMFYNVLSGLLRSIGDSRTPLYFLIFSSFLNIVLDLFLIIKMDMGTAGAAYATVIAQGISAALCFVYMFSHFDVLKTTKDDYYFDARSVYNMLAVGIPMALNYSITAIGTMVMQSAVNVFGSNVVASYTAASKVYNISVQSLPTLGTALATYCGQNLGAKRYDRIYDGMKQGFIICFVAAVCGAAICLGGGRFVVSWFVSNPSEEIFTYAMTYLKIASCFYLPLGMIFLYRNALQGLGEGFFPMISGVLEMLCRLAVIFFVPASAGFAGVCFADPAAWVGAGIPLLIVYLRWERRHQARYTSEKKI
jgi:Na+-driven multidrug efflux pump